MLRSSQKAIDLIHRFEGFDVPWLWPSGDSGITIGYGYDLGYEETFLRDWTGRLDAVSLTRLNAAVGLKGEAAHRLAPSFRNIHIPENAASEVFREITLPKYEAQTLKAFPNSDKLNSDAFGALTSVVFNRGSSLKASDGSDRRKEMLNIFNILQACKGLVSVPPSVYVAIAAEVKSMARLWADHPDSDSDLHDRRIAEAKLIYDSVTVN